MDPSCLALMIQADVDVIVWGNYNRLFLKKTNNNKRTTAAIITAYRTTVNIDSITQASEQIVVPLVPSMYMFLCGQ